MSLGYHNIQKTPQEALALRYSLVDVARFWAKVNKDGPAPILQPALGPCWLWTASVTGSGKVNHGQFTLSRNGQPQVHLYAHRISWELAYGPIPDGLKICHHCDIPRCVRPAHLFLGTQADNLHDAARKGRIYNHKPRTTRAFTPADRLAIYQLPYRRGLIVALARQYGVSKTAISLIRSGRFIGAPTELQGVQSSAQADHGVDQRLNEQRRAEAV